MEAKINIVEILKDKPVNTKLYSPLFSEVYFSRVSGGYIVVEHHGSTLLFLSSGRFYDYDGAEPLLFPSKEMRDWEKFAWKKGDVLYSAGLKEYCVFNKFISDGYLMFISNYNVDENTKRVVPKTYDPDKNTVNYEKVSDEKATEIISLIEEHYGGKLNLSTLEIEKQSEFKDGDVVTIMPHIGDKLIYLFKAEDDEKYYGHVFLDGNIAIVNEDSYCQKDFCTARSSTEEEKQQLFDALEKEGKAWDAEKKQIVDIKKELQFKPFEKVLVRDSYNDMWRASFFSHITEDDGRYVTTCCTWKFCIPYIGNESLVGTTKDVEG